MKECAFCDHTGKLSAEHISSDWMGKLFPGKITAKRFDENDAKEKEWQWNSLDFKTKVVCKRCNETWMSATENQHAKPVLTPLITGEVDIPIDLAKARSMAIFSFKTAVVLDHARRDRESPFFDRDARHLFRETLRIPLNVQMWFCTYRGHRGNGAFLTFYHQPEAASGENWLMYVCTFAIGNIAIQVVAVKDKTERVIFTPTINSEFLPIPFWPGLQADYVWPGSPALRSEEDFRSFAGRWKTIEVISFS
jgi:hypothetical protein